MREYIGNSPYDVLLLLSFVEETCIDALTTVLDAWPGYTAEIFGLDSFFSVESTHSILVGGLVSTEFEFNESIPVDDGF